MSGIGSRSDWLPALAAFEAAARYQNFAHAAEDLHLSASAVSHHVRKLESRLGTKLFQRHARGVSLTAHGRLLADAASDALADLDEVLQGLRNRRDEQQPVRVTMLHSFLNAWMIHRLPAFAQAYPDVGVIFETEIGLTRFDEGGPDLGIRYGPGQWQGLVSQRLMDDQLIPVAAPSLPHLASVRSARDIAHLPLLSDLAPHGWNDWFRAAGVRGIRITERYTFSESVDVLEACAQGLGAALARSRVAAPWLARGRLQTLPGPPLMTRDAYHLVYPAHRPLRPAARVFADWLLSLDFGAIDA